jgi:hypothetical protein
VAQARWMVRRGSRRREMGTLLVTVVHGGRRRDLAVRSDVPVADLLRPLAEALADDPPPPRRPGEAVGQGLALAPLCGQPLPVERSLEAFGVGHGAVLVLIGGSPAPPSPEPPDP